ncbi:TPA: DUF2591 domain-containing protein [Enterobacter cloacae]|nr:DUF2591 domain-containing protein [Enterobacter cloacae]HBC2543655.1 DUF2591 domain-containing protein [Enterobacter cloacae]
MDYSQLSDFEINCEVAKAAGIPHETYFDFSPEPYVWSEKSKSEFDPCNSPADAWPIIESNRISIRNRYEGDWKAENEWGESRFHVARNPLRAAMIVFLMMQEAKHA